MIIEFVTLGHTKLVLGIFFIFKANFWRAETYKDRF